MDRRSLRTAPRAAARSGIVAGPAAWNRSCEISSASAARWCARSRHRSAARAARSPETGRNASKGIVVIRTIRSEETWAIGKSGCASGAFLEQSEHEEAKDRLGVGFHAKPVGHHVGVRPEEKAQVLTDRAPAVLEKDRIHDRSRVAEEDPDRILLLGGRHEPLQPVADLPEALLEGIQILRAPGLL